MSRSSSAVQFMKTFLLPLLLFAPIFLFPVSTHAETGIPDWAGGGPYGGRINALAISPGFSSDRTVFAAMESGGIYKTSDNGLSWTHSWPYFSTVACIAVSPAYATDQTVFAARSDGVLMRSTDGGASWSNVYTGPGFYAMAVSPGFASDRTVIVASSSGIYKTTDGGTVWTRINASLLAQKMVISPSFTSDQTLFATNYSTGVYKSTDGGVTWTAVNSGLTRISPTDIVISPTYAVDGTLFTAADGYIYKSTNAGGSWTQVHFAQAWNTILAISPNYQNDRTVYAGAYPHNGFRKTTDGGSTWTTITTGLRDQDIISLAISPSYVSDGTIFVGTVHSGVYRTQSAGSLWAGVNTGIRANNVAMLAISPDFTNDQTVFAGMSGDGIHKSTDGGQTWSIADSGITSSKIDEYGWSNGYFIKLNCLSVSPGYATDRTVFAGTSTGLYKSGNGGAVWVSVSSLQTTAMALSPGFLADQTIFALTSGGVRKSTNGGGSWGNVNTGITGTAIVIAVSPAFASDQTVFVANSAGELFRSTNGGNTWAKISSGIMMRTLLTSPEFLTDKTLFAVSLYGIFYRSTDGGSTWVQAPELTSLAPLAISATYASDRTLFVGTSYGAVFRSADGGQTWGQFYFQASINSIALSPTFQTDHKIFLGTYNRGAWTAALDADKPVSQITEPSAEQTLTGSSYTISGTSGDTGTEVSSVQVSLDDGATWNWASGSSVAGVYGWAVWQYNWTLPASGRFTIRSRANDTSGNLEVPSPGVTVNIGTAPIIELDPAQHVFGEVLVGGSANRTFTIRSYGAETLSVSSITLVGTDSALFGLSLGSCPSLTPTLAQGESCTVIVSFTPTGAGAKSAALQVASNAPAKPVATVPLTATGVIPRYNLSLSVTGSGGAVTFSTGGSCSGSCSETFDGGTVVTLTPASALGLRFDGWSGACTGTAPCTVTMDAAKSVGASFQLVTVHGVCGSSHNGNFPSAPSTGLCSTGIASAVIGSGPWSWTCQGINGGSTSGCSAEIAMYPLTVNLAGRGTGAVTTSTGLISWVGSTGSASYRASTVVTLTAIPANGGFFSGWGGACSGNWQCTVTIDEATWVTATFNSTTPPVTAATPPGGTYLSAQTVRLASDKPGTIYYTTDGSYPSTTSSVYKVPVTVGTTSTIKFFAVDEQGGTEPVKSETYTFTGGKLWSWGLNDAGQLGGGPGNRNSPAFVYESPVVTMAAGAADSTVFLQSDGTAQSYGYLGSAYSSSGIAVSGSWRHSMTLQPNGTVAGEGTNAACQFGNGSISNLETKTVTGLTAVVALSGGDEHQLALKRDGTVWAWGANWVGQLGDGSTEMRCTPVQVSGLDDVIAIAAGASHSLALKSDGTVWAWGSNWAGQLGDGTTTSSLTPRLVPSLSGVTAVAGGQFHSLALKSDGTVWSWGNNGYGQLGDRSVFSSSVPVPAVGLSGVTGIAAGASHSLALKGDGTVWAWGSNNYGQLGDGSNTDRSAPVQVAGLSGVTAIASQATSWHSLAIAPDMAETVPPVTSAPSSGTFVNQKTITLASNEPATIFYTLDGSDPVTSTTAVPYYGPFTIFSSTTLKYYARDVAGNNEAVRTAIYTVEYSLVLTVAGSTSGIVHSSPTPDFNCSTGYCGQTFAAGTVVSLTASPAEGSVFTGWSGACTGTGLCTITMNEIRSVTATFGLGAINGVCGSSNDQPFISPPVSGLCSVGTASSVSGSGPWYWSCSGSNGGYAAGCATTQFYHSITVTRSGTGAGGIYINPGQLSWSGSTGSATYMSNTTVTLTHSAYTGSVFTGWSGACSGTGPCIVTLDGTKDVTATFDLVQINGACGGHNGQTLDTPPIYLCSAGTPSAVSGGGPWGWTCQGINGGSSASCSAQIRTYAMDLAVAGGGTGVVHSAPGTDLACTGGACSHTYQAGTTVTLSSQPDAGFILAKLTGCDSHSGLECVVSMKRARSVSVEFDTSVSVPVQPGVATSYMPSPQIVMTVTSVSAGAITVAHSSTAPPANTLVLPNSSFEISSDAALSGPITICIDYNPALVTGGADTVRLYHYDQGVWNDVTTLVNTQEKKVCGLTTSFSPFTVGINANPPDTVITGSPGLASNSTAGVFSFVATRSGSTFQCAIDGGIWSSCSSPYAFSGLVAGEHVFRVKAIDPDGVVDGTPAEHQWNVDLTAPDTSITVTPASRTIASNAGFSFSSPDAAAQYECALDGGAWSTCAATISYSSLAVGNHLLQVRAKDPAGNVDPTPASHSWTIFFPKVEVGGTYYETISEGFALLSNGGSLKLRDMEFAEAAVFGRAISFTLKGGYGAGYTAQSGFSTVRGSIQISNGTVNMEGIVIMP